MSGTDDIKKLMELAAAAGTTTASLIGSVKAILEQIRKKPLAYPELSTLFDSLTDAVYKIAKVQALQIEANSLLQRLFDLKHDKLDERLKRLEAAHLQPPPAPAVTAVVEGTALAKAGGDPNRDASSPSSFPPV